MRKLIAALACVLAVSCADTSQAATPQRFKTIDHEVMDVGDLYVVCDTKEHVVLYVLYKGGIAVAPDEVSKRECAE